MSMDREVVRKILDIQDTMRRDPEYERLLTDYERYMGEFMDIMRSLLEEQRSSLENFLGVSVLMHLKMLELACQ